MPGSSYELYYPHMMPICAHDDSYGSVMRIIGMSVCLRSRAGFGRLPRSRATSGRSAPSRRPNLARERPAIEHPARTRAPLTVPFGPLAERLWQNERRREKIRAQP